MAKKKIDVVWDKKETPKSLAESLNYKPSGLTPNFVEFEHLEGVEATSYICPHDCGCLVINVGKHEMWHENQKHNRDMITGIIKILDQYKTILTRMTRG